MVKRGGGGYETKFSYLDERIKEHGPYAPYFDPHDFISEGESNNAVQQARIAKQHLGLEGIVQVEFCLFPSQHPHFVQIRALPKKEMAACIDIDIPEGVPYIESEVCNGVAGDIILPAYVTMSKSGISTLRISMGQSIFDPDSRDEKTEEFERNSKLSKNKDFQEMKEIAVEEIMIGRTRGAYDKVWRRGNALFDEYILVCDKLDESVCGMAAETTNKRAIITCMEASRTSHAMTVARDLGIMAMGIQGYRHGIHDMNWFYHQVETGDVVHMKSNGRKAVAYIQKRREADPYEK